MSNPVNWFEIYVQDMARAATFYEAVFQIKLDILPSTDAGEFPDLEMLTFPMSNEESGASGALVKMADMPSGGNSTLVYFSCEDCAVEAARAAEFGGALSRKKHPSGNTVSSRWRWIPKAI